MARHKMVNGVRVELTDAENEQKGREEAAWAAGAFDRAIAKLRQDRTRRLTTTDFYALQDVAMSDAMTAYRQELRDLPAGLSTVSDVEAITIAVNTTPNEAEPTWVDGWPVKP